MRIRFIWLALCAVATPLLTSPCQADAEGDRAWGANATVGVYSDYMFRGKNVYEGTSLQPSATGYMDFAELGTLSANVWAHTSLETNEPPEKFTEVDYTLSYDLEIWKFALSAGHIFYTFPGGSRARISDTEEFYVGLGLVDVPLNPRFTMYNDYNAGKYQYYTLGFDEVFHCPMLGEDTGIVPHVRFGFASNADDGPVFYKDNGLVHIDTGLAFEVPMGEFYLIPHFNFNFETDDYADNEFWMGVDLSYDM